MFLTLKERVDSLCDYTFGFTWQNKKIQPKTIVPWQESSRYTYQDLVDELRKGGEVHISGHAGRRLGYSMGVDLKHFGGSGATENAGSIFVDGNVAEEMGMGMVSGTIFVKGNIEEPMGNVVEVESEESDYRKFRSITDILCKGPGKDTIIHNTYIEKHLMLNDGVLRGTVAARCNCDGLVSIEGDVYNGTGLLMQKCTVHVIGDAGMNTGAHIEGGTVIVEGTAGEFAGAYMKKGVLILKDAKGFVGANMKDGLIFARKNVKTALPVEELAMAEVDAKLLMKYLDIGHVEAMGYHKYGLVRERLVRMRDGSVVVRRVE